MLLLRQDRLEDLRLRLHQHPRCGEVRRPFRHDKLQLLRQVQRTRHLSGQRDAGLDDDHDVQQDDLQ